MPPLLLSPVCRILPKALAPLMTGPVAGISGNSSPGNTIFEMPCANLAVRHPLSHPFFPQQSISQISNSYPIAISQFLNVVDWGQFKMPSDIMELVPILITVLNTASYSVREKDGRLNVHYDSSQNHITIDCPVTAQLEYIDPLHILIAIMPESQTGINNLKYWKQLELIQQKAIAWILDAAQWPWLKTNMRCRYLFASSGQSVQVNIENHHSMYCIDMLRHIAAYCHKENCKLPPVFQNKPLTIRKTSGPEGLWYDDDENIIEWNHSFKQGRSPASFFYYYLIKIFGLPRLKNSEIQRQNNVLPITGNGALVSWKDRILSVSGINMSLAFTDTLYAQRDLIAEMVYSIIDTVHCALEQTPFFLFLSQIRRIHFNCYRGNCTYNESYPEEEYIDRMIFDTGMTRDDIAITIHGDQYLGFYFGRKDYIDNISVEGFVQLLHAAWRLKRAGIDKISSLIPFETLHSIDIDSQFMKSISEKLFEVSDRNIEFKLVDAQPRYVELSGSRRTAIHKAIESLTGEEYQRLLRIGHTITFVEDELLPPHTIKITSDRGRIIASFSSGRLPSKAHWKTALQEYPLLEPYVHIYEMGKGMSFFQISHADYSSRSRGVKDIIFRDNCRQLVAHCSHLICTLSSLSTHYERIAGRIGHSLKTIHIRLISDKGTIKIERKKRQYGSYDFILMEIPQSCTSEEILYVLISYLFGEWPTFGKSVQNKVFNDPFADFLYCQTIALHRQQNRLTEYSSISSEPLKLREKQSCTPLGREYILPILAVLRDSIQLASQDDFSALAKRIKEIHTVYHGINLNGDDGSNMHIAYLVDGELHVIFTKKNDITISPKHLIHVIIALLQSSHGLVGFNRSTIFSSDDKTSYRILTDAEMIVAYLRKMPGFVRQLLGRVGKVGPSSRPGSDSRRSRLLRGRRGNRAAFIDAINTIREITSTTIAPTITAQEFTLLRRQLLLRYHPDHGGDDSEFQRLLPALNTIELYLKRQ